MNMMDQMTKRPFIAGGMGARRGWEYGMQRKTRTRSIWGLIFSGSEKRMWRFLRRNRTKGKERRNLRTKRAGGSAPGSICRRSYRRSNKLGWKWREECLRIFTRRWRRTSAKVSASYSHAPIPRGRLCFLFLKFSRWGAKLSQQKIKVYTWGKSFEKFVSENSHISEFALEKKFQKNCKNPLQQFFFFFLFEMVTKTYIRKNNRNKPKELKRKVSQQVHKSTTTTNIKGYTEEFTPTKTHPRCKIFD